jgi:hypothetical protein
MCVGCFVLPVRCEFVRVLSVCCRFWHDFFWRDVFVVWLLHSEAGQHIICLTYVTMIYSSPCCFVDSYVFPLAMNAQPASCPLNACVARGALACLQPPRACSSCVLAAPACLQCLCACSARVVPACLQRLRVCSACVPAAPARLQRRCACSACVPAVLRPPACLQRQCGCSACVPAVAWWLACARHLRASSAGARACRARVPAVPVCLQCSRGACVRAALACLQRPRACSARAPAAPVRLQRLCPCSAAAACVPLSVQPGGS